MPKNAKTVIVPGTGRYFRAPVDTPPPGQIINISGTPTAASVPVAVGGQTATAVLTTLAAPTADSIYGNCGAIASALASLSSVGAGNVAVLPGYNAYQYVAIIAPEVTTQTITSTGATFTAGTTPAVAVTLRGAWTPWIDTGYTDNDSPMQVNRSGGDITTQDAWQASAIESSQAPVTYSIAYSLLQYDVDSLKLYHGANSVVSATDGSVQAPAKPQGTEHALFLSIQNGSKYQPRYYPRGSTLAADGENFDTSKLASMPVATQVLQSSTLAFPYSVAPTGVAA